MSDIIASFIIVFLAELGDKTQILAFLFATKYKMLTVLLGIFLGVAANHSLAVIAASMAIKVVNFDILRVFASLIFIVFGLSSLIYIPNDEEENVKFTNKCPVMTVAAAFFIGELGDKTQLTAMSLVFQGYKWYLVLTGTITAMVCVSAIGIIIGRFIGKKIPSWLISRVSGFIFIIFGLVSFYKSYLINKDLNIKIISIALISLLTLGAFIMGIKKSKEEC